MVKSLPDVFVEQFAGHAEGGDGEVLEEAVVWACPAIVWWGPLCRGGFPSEV